MGAVEKFLGDKKYIAGDYVTFVDFFVFEQIEMFTLATDGEFVKKYPTLAAYHQRIASLPKFDVYYKSDRFLKGPFNTKVAKIFN
jgi:glutathione S-transferase